MKNKKKVSSLDLHILKLELEKSKLARERNMLVLNKGVFLYFSFMFVGVIGFTSGYVSPKILNWLILGGIGSLVIGIIPYMFSAQKEQNNLNLLLSELKKKRGL